MGEAPVSTGLARHPAPARAAVPGLPAQLQQQLRRRHVQVFLAEKPFLGCAGLAITDEMRVTIAAHACLLRLNRGGALFLFLELRQVLVYPGAFVVDRVHPEVGGVLREQRRVRWPSANRGRRAR